MFLSFDPFSVPRLRPSWITRDGFPLDSAQGITAYTRHISTDFARDVIFGRGLAHADMLAFLDPDAFQAGALYSYLDAWQYITDYAPSKLSADVLAWIKNRVDVSQFFKPHFTVSFQGSHYDFALPTRKVIRNQDSCKPHVNFISSTILDRLASGAISIWGRSGSSIPLPSSCPLRSSLPSLAFVIRIGFSIFGCRSLWTISMLSRYVSWAGLFKTRLS